MIVDNESDSSICSEITRLSLVDEMTKRPLETNNSDWSSSQKKCLDPHSFLVQILREKGYLLDEKSISLLPSDFFLEVTEKRIADYDHDVIYAIRKRDITMLRELHNQGKSMQCCNKFGESIVHMACRRGFSDVVSFLLDEAKVSLRVKDDYGRTPCHDACWLPEPNWELISILLEHDPDLFLVKDIRGFSPMAYARRADWSAWLNYLDRVGKRIKLRTFGHVSSLSTSDSEISNVNDENE